MDTKIEAFLIDVDGCVITTNGDVDSDYYRGLSYLSRYVKRAEQGDVPTIGFCTGRDRNFFEAVACSIGLQRLQNSWSVIESGVAIFNPATKKLVLNPNLSKEVEETFREITNRQIPKILGENPGLMLYPGNIVCIAIERDPEAKITIEQAYQIIKEDLSDLVKNKVLEIHHSDCSVDISPTGIDKASGLQFLSQYTGINLRNTVGIGDSNGDFPLFEKVGYIACPANASEECKKFVKEKMGYISPYKYALGVANIMDVIENTVFLLYKKG